MATAPLSNIDSPLLEIHVLGGSKGESVIIKLPDGQWGVVDCFCDAIDDPDKNPTIQFLRGRGVETLLFCCLTHAHDDHFLGMVKLIEEFKPAEFWRFGCSSPVHIAKLLQYNELQAKRAVGAKKNDLTRSNKELFNIFNLAKKLSKSGSMLSNRLSSLKTPYPLPSDESKNFKIECLAPSGKQIEKYESAIFDCIGADDRIAKEIKHSDHNEVSVVLKITYGDTVVILGGDLEKAGWEEVVREYGGAKLVASAVKVSHHGSENGYCEKLWEHFSVGGKPVAVIAPQHRHRLPRPVALDHISKHAEAILSTCKPRVEWTAPYPVAHSVSLESRLMLRPYVTAVRLADGTPCGQCSLTFDSKGRTDLELTEPAVSLYREC